jgi:hypothetical protein
MKLVPVDRARGVPTGGYAELTVMSFTITSPSSPADATGIVNVPEDDPDVTAAVSAEVADADPAEFDAVTTTRIVDPTSALVNAYELAFEPTPTHPAEHRCH